MSNRVGYNPQLVLGGSYTSRDLQRSPRLNHESRRVWPPPLTRDIALLILDLYLADQEDYLAKVPHGCRSWNDGSWD